MEDPVLCLCGRAPETNARVSRPFAMETSKSLNQPMDCLSRLRGVSAFELWRALSRRPNGRSGPSVSKSLNASSCANPITREECLSSFDSANSQLVLERIMSQLDVSPLTSGRLSHNSETRLSPSDELEDDLVKLFRAKNELHPLITNGANRRPTSSASLVNTPVSGARTVGRWLKDRREKKKEESRVHNAQIHAAVSVASVTVAVAAIAAATAAQSSGRTNEEMAKMDMALASAATLVAAQCVEAAEAMGADREHLVSVVSSAVNVRGHDDITTLTAAAATALRGAATLKARTTKDRWNIAAVVPADRGIDIGLCGRAATGYSHSGSAGEVTAGDSFSGVCIRDFLANGTELLERTRKGDLHRKIVFVYVNEAGQVILKMKSRHIAGAVTKKDENVIVDVCKNNPAFHDGEQSHYFGLKTATRGIIEFECKNLREYEIWTHGVSRLLSAAAEKNRVFSSDMFTTWG